MPQTRQLAAIMFTDIVGYTTMMGDDEQKAFELLEKNRQIQKPLIKQHGGKWIKELGDGVLASFVAATDAVTCACSIIKGCAQAEGLSLRISIHLGEVIFEKNDVFGDGVNIASRLQSHAPIGGICISETVRDNVRNRREIQTRFIKEERLKHVKEPIRIYEVMVDCEETSKQNLKVNSIDRGRSKEKSIAVLPFVNMSNDPEQEYFSDGMAEEILNSLAHLKDLKVAGRTSSFQFKGKNVDLQEIGQKLHVSTILEGSVRKQGHRLRITAQLIDVQEGFHIWSERYDRDMDDIFAIQDEIAFAITEKLKVTLLEKEREAIIKTHTTNTEAYELYLKGRFYMNRRGFSILKGVEYLEEAIKIDPEFAIAYAGYADGNILAAFYSMKRGKDVMDNARTAAETAIKLDPSLCEPYSSLGFYYTALDWQWDKAKQYFEKSLEINPNYVFGNYSYGLYYHAWAKGNFKEAEKYSNKALKAEPLSAIVVAVHALIFYSGGKFEESVVLSKAGLELDPYSFVCYRNLTLDYIALKQYKEAIDNAEYLINISKRHQHAVTDLLMTYCAMGEFEKAKALFDELKERSGKEFIGTALMGLSAASIGNMEEAYSYYESALEEHDPMLLTMRYLDYPKFLQNDSRFRDIIKTVGYEPL